MKEDVKNKWVAALRSGKYKQTTGALKTAEGHCCLGVLCEVLGHEACYTDAYRYSGEKSILPISIQEEAGMATPIGSWIDSHRCLTELNDDGKSFSKIAEIIEENWENL